LTKTLEWLPGAAGQHLFNADDGSRGWSVGVSRRPLTARKQLAPIMGTWKRAAS
jgi:hypothetical protein